MLIDAHVHLPKFGETSRDCEEALYAELIRWGVDLAIVSCLGAWTHRATADEVRAANRQAAAFVRRHPERARFLAYLDPQLDSWPRELDDALKDGAIGIKLWVALKDEAGRLDRTHAVLGEAERRNLPVLIHVFDRTDGNLPGEISMAEFAALSRKFPRCMLVAAHGGGNFPRCCGVLARSAGPGTGLDLSGGMPQQGMADAYVRADGAARVLWGSDFHGRSLGSQLAKLEFARLTPRQYRAVAAGNAIRVFGLRNLPPELPKFWSRPVKRTGLFREDHFCFTGRLPCSDRPGDTPRQLEAKLAAAGVERAYAADLDSAFALDPAAALRRFRRRCRDLALLRPLAVVDPSAPNWEDGFAAARDGGFAGLWISPYLHAFRLDDPAYAAFFRRCAAAKLKLWINTELGDYRFRPSAWQPRPVALPELTNFLAGAPRNHYCFQAAPAHWLNRIFAEKLAPETCRFDLSKLTDQGTAFRDFTARYGTKQLAAGSEYPVRPLDAVAFAAR